MTTQRSTVAGSSAGFSIGNERKEDQDPTQDDQDVQGDDEAAEEEPRNDKPAPDREPSKDAPAFAPGSPENVPPGPTSA